MPSNPSTAGELTQLEQTIIGNARFELEAVMRFFRRKAEPGTTAEAFDEVWREYLGHLQALNAYTGLSHQANSGLSEEGSRLLREIEADYVAAYQASTN